MDGKAGGGAVVGPQFTRSTHDQERKQGGASFISYPPRNRNRKRRKKEKGKREKEKIGRAHV